MYRVHWVIFFCPIAPCFCHCSRLGILYLITCGGLGYGRLEPRADAFLGSIGSPDPPLAGVPSGLRLCERRICLPFALHPWTGATIARPGYLPASHLLIRLPPPGWSRAPRSIIPKDNETVRAVSIPGLAWAVLRRYGNINPLSIDYACRPRLRSRLTQGRLA